MIEKWDVTIPSLTGDEPREAYCYVPDSINEDPDRRYPVLYMFDGQNVFFDEDASYGKSWGMLDWLEYTGTQIIVAAVACNQSPDNSRLEEYCPWTCYMPGTGMLHGRGRQTMDWFVDEFKPYIDENYPTLPDRKHTFIAGSSMGGLMSLYALSRYNKFFSRAAALSPSLEFAEQQVDKMVAKARYRRGTVLYMDMGSKEISEYGGYVERMTEVGYNMMQKKVAVTSRVVPDGDHSEGSWERQIPFFMETLLYGLDD